MMQAGTERLSRSIAAAAAALAGVVAEQDAALAGRVASELETRLEALTGEAAFSDLPPGLREAALQALQITLSIYEAGLPKEAGDSVGPGRAFHLAAVQFSASELAAMTASRGVTGLRRSKRSNTRVEPSGGPALTLAQLRLAAEESLLSDLDLALGPHRIPERFLALFLDTERRGTSWFDAFGLYVAWYIRSDGGLSAALAEADVPALAALELDMAGLLERLFTASKDTALRLEQRLAEAEATGVLPEDAPNGEVAAFLARLSAEIAQRLSVPPAAISAIQRTLLASGFEPSRLEERLTTDAERLAALLTDLPPKAGAAEGDVAARNEAQTLISAGFFTEAATAIERLPASAEREWLLALLKSVTGAWVEVRGHLNRTIEQVGGGDRSLAIRAALLLAEALGRAPGEGIRGAAFDLYKTLLSASDSGLEPSMRTRALLTAAEIAIGNLKGPRQLTALTFTATELATLASGAEAMGPQLAARLCRTRGDVALALTAHGADRTGEAGRLFAEGIAHAARAQDIRLLSELHVRHGEVVLRQARAASATEAPTYRLAADEAVRAALVGGLRGRDPVWWVDVRVRIAESAIAIGAAASDAAQVRAGVIAAKTALRLADPEAMPSRHCYGLGVLGDGFAALAKIEPARPWRGHAVDSYELAVAGTDPAVHPLRWTNLQVKIAGLLMPEGSEPELELIEQAIARYQSALPLLKPGVATTQRVQKLLADALAASGKRRLDPARLDQAATVYRELVERSAKTDIALCGNSRLGLAGVLLELARLRNEVAAIDEAIALLGQVEAQGGPRGQLDKVQPAFAECRKVQRQLAGQRQGRASGVAESVARALRSA